MTLRDFSKAWILPLVIKFTLTVRLITTSGRTEIGTTTPLCFAINRTPGLCLPAPDNADVLAIFELFFTVELLTILVTETNRYAKRYLDEKLDTLGLSAGFRKWTVSEMHLFTAVIINMGLVKLTDLQDFWSTDEIVSTQFFPGVMVRDQFLTILVFSISPTMTTLFPEANLITTPFSKLANRSEFYVPNFMMCIIHIRNYPSMRA